MKNNPRFGAIGIALVIAAVGLVGFIGWRLYDTDKTQQTNTTLQSEQSDKNDHRDPNAGYIVIKEWGVRFKPVDGFDGVEYFKPSFITGDSLTFTTKALADAAATCSPSSDNIVLGLLTRNTETVPANGGVVATIGNYTYQYRGPDSTCGAGDLEIGVVSKISQSLKSLETAK